MKAVIQRVSRATVEVDGEVIARIGQGLLLLLGIAKEDQDADAEYIVDKVIGMRVFGDAAGKMNRAIGDIEGQLLVVSQFTLLGDLRHGRRPGFDGAAPPDRARILYDRVVVLLRERRVPVETGRFAATMRVSLDNEGPVTFLLDSQAEATKTQVQ
jgi:D-tyrosyl-tRNA(Tyr) deacylase